MIPDPKDVAAIQERCKALFLEFDGRTVAAVLGVQSARAYQTLRMIGAETPESLRKLFDYLHGVAMETPEKAPRVIYQSDTPDRTQ